MAAQLIYAVVAVGLSLLAGYLLQKKNKSPIDDKPTVLATRGSFIPVLKGKRRLGLIFAWAGNRVKRRVKQGKKKWYKKREKVDTYYEDGWHVLCVGPAQAIYEIEQGGVPIFQGLLTRDSHPSGSTIPLGDEGSFKVYWGEDDQPVDATLAVRTGIASRWPGICYVFWQSKLLGVSPQWQQMTYVVETYPQSTILANTPGVTVAGSTVELEVPIWGVWRQTAPNANASDPTLWVMLVVPAAGFVGLPPVQGVGEGYANQKTARIEDNVGLGMTFDGVIRGGGPGHGRTLADEIAATQPFGKNFESGVFEYDATAPTDQEVTYITFAAGSNTFAVYDFGMNPPDASGTLSLFAATEEAGWNPAHIIAELLFETWPHGIGEDQGLFDMDSLEELGTLTAGAEEDLRCSVLAQSGQDLRGLLSGIMQDVGVFLSIDMTTGLLKFVPIREPVGDIPEITNDAILTEPEVEVQHGPRPVDRIVFTFPDSALAYRDATVGVDDDGQAGRLEYYQARNVQIISTVNFETAARIAERRSAEEMAGVYENRLQMGRGARALLPGQPVVVEGLDEVQRVIATEHDVESGRVTVTVWNDFYGVPLSNFVTTSPGSPTTNTPTQQDYLAAILEVPEALLNEGQTTIIPMMVRGGTTVTSHMIYLSTTGMTYTESDIDEAIMAGGFTSGFPNDLYFQEEGPIFEAVGDDIGTVEDLTGEDLLWTGGRQLAVFVNSTGQQEIAFVRNIQSLGSGRYRLRGVIRARYDTTLLTLDEGSKVFIFQDDDPDILVDDNVVMQNDLYMKAQPIGLGIVPLDQVDAVQCEIYGKGVRPIPVREIYLDTGADDADDEGNTLRGPHYYITTGADPADTLAIRWNYSTPTIQGTGAGEFPAGQASYDPIPEGDFILEILDSMDVVKRTETISAATAGASYAYTRAARLADFTTEPALFKVRVTQVRGAYLSDPTTQVITNAT